MPEPDTRDPSDATPAAAELEQWRRSYTAQLAGARGAWSMAALRWLTTAELRLGRDGDVPLPRRYPARVATLRLVGDAVRIVPQHAIWLDGARIDGPVEVPADDVALRLGEEPDAAEVVLLRRGVRVGARVFDPLQGASRRADDVAWYPLTPGWIVDAAFEPATDGATWPIVNVLGDVSEAPVSGTLHFELQGVACALLALAAGPHHFVNFRDASSGVGTYGAGRFLRVEATNGSATRLDFHRAHHPPCAHTPHATCPLPPLANRLGVAVEAGERLPDG